MKFRPLLLLSGSIVSASLGASAFALLQPDSEPDPVVDLRLLRVASRLVQLESGYAVEDRFLGQIEAARSSQLGFELPGTVSAIHTDEGESVRTGEPLAKLDTAQLEAARRQARAALGVEEAALVLAEATLARTRRLSGSGAVSEQNLDTAVQQRDAARAAVARATAALESIEVDLAKSELRAPYDGKIARRAVDEGTSVGAGQLVLEMLESGRLEARIGVLPEHAQNLRPGTEAHLTHTATGRGLAAIVRRVLPRQDARTRTVEVIFELAEASGILPGDLVAWTRGTRVSESGAWLPRGALTGSARGLWAGYALLPDGEGGEGVFRLERRELEVLHVEGGRAFVRGAIAGGDRFVVEGLQRLVPGQRVKLADATIPPPLADRN